MARQTSIVSLLLVFLLGFLSSGVQGLNFEDLIGDKIDKKLEKYCKLPGLESLCPDEPDVSTSADVSASEDGRRNLRA